MRLALVLFIMTSVTMRAAAGRIVSITGPTQITRADSRIVGAVDVGVEMMDVVETLESRTGIVFQDDTKVSVTEHSKLKIDSFVYDPGTGKGKIGLKAALGTVRYASGRIAHNSRENVNVQTPTASVAVRGTDFSMTVDEMGRSLVILLPTKVNGKNVVGIIDVTTEAGTVTMNKAFQGTFVASSMSVPTQPVVFNLDEGSIGNDLMLDSPKPLDAPPQVGGKDGEIRIQQKQPTEFEDNIIRLIDSSKFVFVEDGPISKVNNVFSGNTIRITVPQSSGATLKYDYVGGSVTAKNGTGVGVNITIIQK